jgi:hypothetical protein
LPNLVVREGGSTAVVTVVANAASAPDAGAPR